jgi:hypothetical protein
MSREDEYDFLFKGTFARNVVVAAHLRLTWVLCSGADWGLWSRYGRIITHLTYQESRTC